MSMKRVIAVAAACLSVLVSFLPLPLQADQNKLDITGQPVEVDLFYARDGLDSVQLILRTGTEYLRLQCNPATMPFCSVPTNLLGTSCTLVEGSSAPTGLDDIITLTTVWSCRVGAPTGCFRVTGYTHADPVWGGLPIVGLVAATTCTPPMH